MLNYIYGATTMFLITIMVGIVDANVPNDLMYWIDLYSPF